MTADCDDVEIRGQSRRSGHPPVRERFARGVQPMRCLFIASCLAVVGSVACAATSSSGGASSGSSSVGATGHALRRDAPQRGRDGHLSLARARRSRRAARSVFGRQGRAARRPRPRTRRRGATNPRIASSSPSRSCSRKARTAPPGAPSTLQPPHAPAIRAARRGDRRRPAGARSSSRRDTASPSCT